MRLLFDTNIVSYWHSGIPGFRMPLTNFVSKIRKANKKTSLYISVITIQELACWAKPVGQWESIRQFIAAHFAQPLPFCEASAYKAADMQVRGGPTGRMSEAEKAEWHHDVALVGTAIQHELDMIVTSDRGMYTRYSSKFNEIVHLTKVGT